MNDWMAGAVGVAALLLAYCLGWAVSASTIGIECQKLGAFYVDKSVYECKKKEQP